MSNRRTISNIPGWLSAGVDAFKDNNELQSWSQAAIVLMAVGLHRLTVDDPDELGYIAGTEEAENEIYNQYAASEFDGSFEDWLIATLGTGWGGKR